MNTVKKQTRFKLSLVFGLVILMFLSFNGNSIENTIAKTDSITKNLTPTTIVKDYYTNDLYNTDRTNQKLKVTDNLTFIKMNMPLPSKTRNELATNENGQSFINDNAKYLPAIVVDEIPETGRDASEEKRKNIILEGIKNHLNLASFSLKDNNDSTFELGITGIKELEKYPNTIVTIYLIENFVNCNFTFGEWEKEYKTSLENLVRIFPLTPTGKTNVKVKNGETTTINFKANIPTERKNNYSLVCVLKDAKKDQNGVNNSLAAGIVSLANTKPAELFWNNWHDNIVIGKSDEVKMEVAQKIGLTEMKLSLDITDENTDWQFIRFKIAQTEREKERYEILGVELNPELKAKEFEFDPEKREVIVELEEPYNKLGKIEIVSLITHNIKAEEIKTSSSYQFQDLLVENSKHELIHLGKIQDIKRNYPIRYFISSNPFDLNGDTWIDDKDMQAFLPEFGKNSKDKDFDEKFDLVPDRRINIKDLCALLKEINEQDKLMEKVKKSNPDFQKNPNNPIIGTRYPHPLPPLKILWGRMMKMYYVQ